MEDEGRDPTTSFMQCPSLSRLYNHAREPDSQLTAQRRLHDEQQDPAARREPQDLGHEPLVQRREALFAGDRHESAGRQ